MRTAIIVAFVGLILPASAHAAMDCGQANPRATRTIFEQGGYAQGANPTHTGYKAALPTITEHADHTRSATFPLYNWSTAEPAGTLTVQLQIVYLVCNPLGPPPYQIQPAGTPGTCPYIYLKGYPAV